MKIIILKDMLLETFLRFLNTSTNMQIPFFKFGIKFFLSLELCNLILLGVNKTRYMKNVSKYNSWYVTLNMYWNHFTDESAMEMIARGRYSFFYIFETIISIWNCFFEFQVKLCILITHLRQHWDNMNSMQLIWLWWTQNVETFICIV